MYKLLSNSIYGKLLCNQLNYSNYTYICEDKDKFMKRICNENFVNLNILHENRVIITSRKKRIRMSFPNYIGFSILEKSRRNNYKIYYDILLPIFFKNNCSLIYSDTDSWFLKYEIYLDECTTEDYF